MTRRTDLQLILPPVIACVQSSQRPCPYTALSLRFSHRAELRYLGAHAVCMHDAQTTVGGASRSGAHAQTRRWAGVLLACNSTQCSRHVYIYMYMHAYIHAYIPYKQTYVHRYIPYKHACMHACMHAYIHTCIHAYMHTCIHTIQYMHTCMHACMHHSLAHSLTRSLGH